MQRLLLITYWYPPRQGVGALRPGGLAKYLPRFGWEPIVLTPRLPEGPRPDARVIEIGYRNLSQAWRARLGLDATLALSQQLDRLPLPLASTPLFRHVAARLVRWGHATMSYPDGVRGWIPSAQRAIAELRRTERVDAIVSTAPPVSGHLIAQTAKAILQCPWIADFRDPWTGNPYLRNGIVRRLMEEGLEGATLRDANALTAVTAPWIDDLRQRHRPARSRWIPNGFDPDEFPSGSSSLSADFSITHTGGLYQGKRNPELLLSVVRDLIAEGRLARHTTRLHFYGPIEPWLRVSVQRHGLEDVVRLHGLVARSIALKAQRESQVLLLLRSDDRGEAGVCPAKVFEYLGAKRPIIALAGPPGVAPDLLHETKAGSWMTSTAQLRDWLIAAYAAFQRSGRVPYDGDESATSRYTHERMAQAFAEVLDAVTAEARERAWFSQSRTHRADARYQSAQAPVSEVVEAPRHVMKESDVGGTAHR